MSEIKTVGIVGSGTMGTGIAIVVARAGLKTIVLDARQDALDNARKQAAAFLAKSVARGKLEAGQDEAIMAQWNRVPAIVGPPFIDLPGVPVE